MQLHDARFEPTTSTRRFALGMADVLASDPILTVPRYDGGLAPTPLPLCLRPVPLPIPALEIML